MSELPVYIVVQLEVKDADEYRKYEKGFFPILKRFDGEFLTYDDNFVQFEGEGDADGRMILIKFPSETLAREWYNDPEYQKLSEHRRKSTKLHFLRMVHDLAPRG